jgi:GNAT superfamily N-acetyltransferase
MAVTCLLSVAIAEASDAEALRRVAVSAFGADEAYKPPGAIPGGPPGHDRLARHQEWIRRGDYYKASFGGRIVGGCIVKPHPDRLALFGLFVDAVHMRQGIGAGLVTAVLARYPDDIPWTLETPDYSVGNHRFYERLGFRRYNHLAPDPELGFGFYVYHRPPGKVSLTPGKEKAP